MADKRPVGRPTKYTEEMCITAINAGKDGASVAEIAVACNVSIPTLYEWSSVHEEFSKAFTRAQTEAEAFHARRVREGLERPPSEYQGQANLKYMAQRFQERWSERHRHELSGPEGNALEFTVKLVKPDGH